MEHLLGQVEEIIFFNEENGYTVAKLRKNNSNTFVTIVGTLTSVQPGETLSLQGEWKRHPTYGKQFEVSEHEIRSPSDLVGLQKYLESGLIKGIGPVYAKKIVSHFGLATLDVLDHKPKKLLEIPGIKEKRIQSILTCLEEQKSARKVMIFLRGHGVTPAYAQKIYRKYGEKSIEKVNENPYQLAKEIFGIGFKIADGIAKHLGFATTSLQRIEAGIEHFFFELSQEGHTCYPENDFLVKTSELLAVDLSLVKEVVEKLIQNQTIFRNVLTDKKVLFLWHRLFYSCERKICEELFRLLEGKSELRAVHQEKAITWVEQKLKIRLAEEQKQAIQESLHQKIEIITGGPGTGKSTITKAILKILEKISSKILLAAPTGRAAKRLSEITRKKAFTIHSLLEYDFIAKNFRKNKNFPLDCDLIIIDEVSMVDTFLFYHLLNALPTKTRVILVGDVDQLPSVGAGNILKDLIFSEKIPVIRLQKIFRQAQNSLIIQNAHRINQGIFPILTSKGGDFLFYECQETEEIKDKIFSLLKTELSLKRNFHSVDDIQLLSPMKRGILGTENMNLALQSLLNPSSDPFFYGGHRFHQHDKIMQIRNNYSKNVFNGDIGKILAIDRIEQQMIVEFDEKKVSYDFSELDELTLAYAVSVHKYQGSEYPCIIMPVHLSHFILLYRNLLYTAVTRGKKLVVLVGSKKALAVAIKNREAKERYTGLLTMLEQMTKKENLLFPKIFQS